MSCKMEWAKLGGGVMVIATADRAWLRAEDTSGSDGPFGRGMTGPGSLATTRRLLDGALAAAWNRAPVGTPPPMTPARWVWRLAGYYHLTHATPGLMTEAAPRFASAGRSELAAWAARKAHEEQGHDLLALRDIQALCHPARAVIAALVPPTAAALTDHLTRSVRAPDPIGCVGYAYTLERLAMAVGEREIRAVQALLPPGVDATRCMRVHSAVGSDADHVGETVATVAALGPEERARVAAAVHETTLLCVTPRGREYQSDEEIRRALSALDPSRATD
jgi:hypothetical protein